MKKTILAVAALAVSLTGFSQDLMSKKGEAILPEAGDYALGFDAVPLFNALKFNDANAKIAAGYPNQYFGVMMKRFTDAKTAWRFGVRLGLASTTFKEDVNEFNSGVEDAGNTVENRITTTGFDVTLSLGQEFRRGNTRVQGYYGYEGLVSLRSNRTNVDYGNNLDDLTASNPYVGTNAGYGTDSTTFLNSGRSGVGFGVGARAFVGVEYFIAPKISLNAEYGFAAVFNTSGRGEREITTVNAGDTDTQTIEGTTRTNTFNLATDITQGSIRVIFHF
ncbi:MAG: hypothetical protein V4616_03200 [Bacteroidota bacterium]